MLGNISFENTRIIVEGGNSELRILRAKIRTYVPAKEVLYSILMQFRIESCTFSNSEEFGCTFKFYTLGKKHIISKTHKGFLHFLDPVCTKSKVLEREENILFTLPKSGRLATIKRLVCRLRFSIEANSRSQPWREPARAHGGCAAAHKWQH